MTMQLSTDFRSQLIGGMWKIVSCACFAGINGIVRYLTGGAGEGIESALPVYVIIFFQNLFGTLFMLPWIVKNGYEGLKTTRPILHSIRVIIAVLGIGLWYWGLYYMPLAQAVALSFTGPIFTVLGAALFLRERIDVSRWLAIGICFIGAFVITRPDKAFYGTEIDAVGLAAFLPLAAAIAFAASKLLSRVLAGNGESPESMTFYLLILMAPVSLIPASYDWVMPSAHHWSWLVAMGVLASGAHYFLTRSLAQAEVSFIMPFGYSKILISAVIGWFAFAEFPKSWTLWVGSAIIFVSVILLTMPKHKKIQLQNA